MKLKPTRKVSAGVLAGFVQAIFVWFWNGKGMQPVITGEVASAALPVLTFIVSWLVPDKIEADD